MFQKTKGWDTLSGSALAFLIFRIFFKISLRVLAGRAKLRRFFTLYHISAVEAYPSRLRRLRGKHLAVPNLVEIFNESFLVHFFDRCYFVKKKCDSLKALFSCFTCKLRIHSLPLEMLSACGGIEIFLGRSPSAKTLKPNFCVLPLVF